MRTYITNQRIASVQIVLQLFFQYSARYVDMCFYRSKRYLCDERNVHIFVTFYKQSDECSVVFRQVINCVVYFVDTNLAVTVL